jgi:hypothetical protein
MALGVASARQLCTSGKRSAAALFLRASIAHQMIKNTAPIYPHLIKYNFAK